MGIIKDKTEKFYAEIDAEFEKISTANKNLSSSLKCRDAKIKWLENKVEELKEQNQKLSAQIEKHLEEKSNGNWAKEGAVVWHGKQKVKGVLLANEKGELYVMAFKYGKGFNTPFNPYMGQIEPYKGQDKEEVEPCYFSSIEKGDFLVESKNLELAVVVCAKFQATFRAICVRAAKVGAHTYKKGETYDFSKGAHLFENIKP